MAPLRVLVAGAGGKTGMMALRRLAAKPQLFAASGAARTAESAARVQAETGAACVTCDITDAASVAHAVKDADALVLLTSAAPKPFPDGKGFGYSEDGMPERVDWEGGRNLIDAAKQAGTKHVVCVSSMGGTMPDHMLNKMGGGNILLWKRKAEMHLVASGIPYTVIHPGGLQNKPGGERELVVGVDDTLMSSDSKTVPREDVAEVVMQCLLEPAAVGRSFDIVATDPEKIPGRAPWDGDLKGLLASLGGKNCDYAAGPKHAILGNASE